jgi:hypothetical protein
MSLGRYLGLAVVAIWLVVAIGFAASDISILVDPQSRRALHVCSNDGFPGRSIYVAELSERECLPRLAMRGGFDALMVGLPLMVGFPLVSWRTRRRSRSRRASAKYRVLSSSVSSAKTSRFAPK